MSSATLICFSRIISIASQSEQSSRTMELRALVPLLILPLLSNLHPGMCSEDEDRLVKDLLARYNRLIRPVRYMNESVKVEFTLILSLLINVKWVDPHLSWDPANYGGIQSIRLPTDKIWIPDVVLINNADGKYTESYKANIVVYAEGNLLWLPPSLYKSTCDIKVKHFPFDEQICDMKFQSWTYNADEVMLDFAEGVDRIEMTNYQPSGTWDVVKAPGFKNHYQKSKLHPWMVDITYRIIIRRKTLFYTINLLIPTVLVSFLSVLVFYLPTVAGEKVSLSISILVTLNVFLLLVSKLLPPASDLPLIGKFLLFTFLMNLVSIVITVVTINLNFRGPTTHVMPLWLRRVFLEFLPMVLLMRRPRKAKKILLNRGSSFITAAQRRRAFSLASRIQMPNHHDHGEESFELGEVRSQSQPRRPRARSRSPGTRASSFIRSRTMDSLADQGGLLMERSFLIDAGDENSQPDAGLISPDARLVTNSIDCIVQYHRQNDIIHEVEDDWKYVALVVDRLLLWIFFLATTVGSFRILLGAPSIFESLETAKNKDYF